MSPPVLNELGLFSALEWLTEQIKTRHGIDVNFITSRRKQTIPIAHEIEVLLFQATRELLVNIVKHAQANSARVKVSSDDQKLRIEVSDDGKGFDIKSTFQPEFKGYGLYSIRERLRHIGGQMAIKSNPGHGTTVLMLAPREIEK
jgi:signal transduction histidine kinase